MALGVVVTSALLRWDMRRLAPERFRRAWNRASFWSAVVAFGPLSVPVHFARTRRSASGFALGLAWMVGVIVLLGLASEVTALVFGQP